MKKVLKTVTYLLILTMLVTSFSFTPIALAKSGVMKEIYVDYNTLESGNGSIESPFKTIIEARDYIRTINDEMTGDIIVYLREGTHYMAEPLVLTMEDSANNGYEIIYQSYSGEEAQLSGAKIASGFTDSNSDGIWEASFNEDIHSVFMMDVNGKTAIRAARETSGTMLKPYDDLSDEAFSVDGFYTKKEDFPIGLYNLDDVQIRVSYMWRTYIFHVKDVIQDPDDSTQNIVVLKGLTSEIVNEQMLKQKNPDSEDYIIGWKFTIENAKEYLDKQGEVYFDNASSVKKIYYKPRNGENMENATVEVPVLENLISIEGENSLSKVEGISFKNIVFENSAWQSPLEYGFITGQSQCYYSQPQSIIDGEFIGSVFVPAAIGLNFTDGITIENNTFRNIGSVGIGLYQGAENTRITGNIFTELSDSAITVGLPNQARESEEIEGINLAEGKKATANAYNGETTPVRFLSKAYWRPDAATIADETVGWHSLNSSTELPWWQVDLGDEYEIDRVEIVSRYDADQSPTRRNFQILASNDPTFETSVSVLAEQGSTAFNHQATAVYNVSDTNKYRYVRIKKTVKEIFFLREVRVINEEMDFARGIELSRHNDIKNNIIKNVGLLNWGAPGIQSYFTEDLEISHNELYSLPYSGICSGWGWNNYFDMTQSRNITISNNHISGALNRMLDGGGIYTLGPQPESTISGNFIENLDNAITGVYLDTGSNFWNITGNVFEDLVFSYSGGADATDSNGNVTLARTNSFTNNYSTAPDGKAANLGSNNTNGTVEPTHRFISGVYDENVSSIIMNAGLEDRYISNRNKVAGDTIINYESFSNAINVTNNGSMNDRRFLYWHLRYQLESAKNELDDILDDEAFTAEARETFQSVLDEVDASYTNYYAQLNRSEALNRAEIIADRQKLLNALKALGESTYDDIKPLTELITECSSSIEAVEGFDFNTATDIDLYGTDAEKKIVRKELQSAYGNRKATYEKRVTLNVARGRKIVDCHGTSSATGPECVADDDFTNNKYWYGKGDGTTAPYFVMDLGRFYKIDKMVLFNRTDESTGNNAHRGKFEIWGSDSVDFENKVLLYESNLSATDSLEFYPLKGHCIMTPLANTPVRYVMYKSKVSTNNAPTAVRELQLYSDVTVVEVSRGADTFTGTSTYSGYSGDKAVDGNTGSSDDNAYAASGASVYPEFTVDLKDSYYISMIEIVSRRAATNATMNGNFDILGSASNPTSGNLYETLTSDEYISATGATKLASVKDVSSTPVTLSDGTIYQIMQAYSADAPLAERSPYYIFTDDTNAHRFITYRKNNVSNAQFAEFRAMVIKPEFFGAVSDNGQIILEFSDSIKEESVNENSVELFDSSGSKVNYDDISVLGNKIIISAEDTLLRENEKCTVKVASTVVSSKNVALVQSKTEDEFEFSEQKFDYKVFEEKTEVSKTQPLSFKVRLKGGSEGKNYFVALALYKGDKLECVSSQQCNLSIYETKDINLSIPQRNEEDDLSGYSVKTFVWKYNSLTPLKNN